MTKVGQDAVFNNLHKSILSILKRRDGKKNEQVVIAPDRKTQEEKQKRDVAIPKTMLRSQPIQGYSEEVVKVMLKDKGFFDKDLNNAAPGFSHHYEVQKEGTVVYDHASGLMWQQSGSVEKIPYREVKAYIDTLNSQGFAGYRDWRLPTLEEAMSLMEPTQKNGALYIDPKFGKQQYWIWTSDRYSASSAWVVDLLSGGCSSHGDFYSYYYVRAVR